MDAPRPPSTDPGARRFLGLVFGALGAVGLLSAVLPHHEGQPYLVPVLGALVIVAAAVALLRRVDRPLRPRAVHALVASPPVVVTLVLLDQRDQPVHVEAGVYFVAAGLIAAIATTGAVALVSHLVWIAGWLVVATLASDHPAPLWNLVTILGVTVMISLVAGHLRQRELHDHSAVHRAAEVARRHQEQLGTVLAGIDHGVLLHDDSGRITYANPTAARLLGHDEGEIVGLHTDTLLSDALDGDGDGDALGSAFTPIADTLRDGRRRVHRELGVPVDDGPRWMRLSTAPAGDDPPGVVCSLTDVGPEREQRAALRSSEARFRTLAEQSPLPIHLMRPDGSLAYVNPAFEALTGWTADEVLAHRAHELVHPEDLRDVRRALRQLFHSGGSVALEHRIVRRDGTERTVRSDAALLSEEPTRFVCTVTDLTELYRLRDRLSHAATHDPLTGLANRALADDRLGAALARCGRGPTAPVALFVDLDRFKDVNDTLGHGAGDEVLVTIADRVVRCVRAEDLVARLGGDELLVLLDSTPRPGRGDVDALAHEILGAIGVPIALEAGDVVSVTASIGVAVGGPGVAADALVAAADAAAYEAKRAGRARVAWADALVPG
jgi:diguanylate cyclase (GGDEF)-like protein/PAS domain S-box-containing protein